MDEGQPGFVPPERKPRSWLYAVFAVGALLVLLLLYLLPIILVMGMAVIPFILIEQMGTGEGEWTVADTLSGNGGNGTWIVSSYYESTRLRVVCVPEDEGANASWSATVRVYDCDTGLLIANRTFEDQRSATLAFPKADGQAEEYYLVDYRFEGVASHALLFEEEESYDY